MRCITKDILDIAAAKANNDTFRIGKKEKIKFYSPTSSNSSPSNILGLSPKSMSSFGSLYSE